MIWYIRHHTYTEPNNEIYNIYDPHWKTPPHHFPTLAGPTYRPRMSSHGYSHTCWDRWDRWSSTHTHDARVWQESTGYSEWTRYISDYGESWQPSPPVWEQGNTLVSELAPSRSQYVYNHNQKSLFRIGNDNMSKISGRVRWLRGEEYSQKEWEIKERK